MTKRRQKLWSKVVEESGIRVRLFERRRGGPIYRDIIIGRTISESGKPRTEHDIRSMKHSDKALAERQARALAERLKLAQLSGESLLGSVTLGQLFTLYRAERIPNIPSRGRRQFAETHIQLFTRAWGADFPVLDLSQTHVDHFSAARRAGELSPFRGGGDPNAKGRKSVGVRDGTIDGDFRWLRSVFLFARKHRVNGRAVLPDNPLEGLSWPREANKARPVASHDRYVKTQEYTDVVDPTGRLRCIVALARYTGRRESAICRLRAHDVLRTPEAIQAALAEAGMDEGVAEYMPHGAIRWPADTDKQGFLFVAPLSQSARAEVDRYLRKSLRLGDVPLFPGTRTARPRKGETTSTDPRDAPIRRDVAATWLLKAERLAKLPKLTRGLFHPYRRLWATERKGLPAKDVAHAGGWKDVATMEMAYQQTDAKTTLEVVQHGG